MGPNGGLEARAKGYSPRPRGIALLEPRCLHVMQIDSGKLDAHERRAERATPGLGSVLSVYTPPDTRTRSNLVRLRLYAEKQVIIRQCSLSL